MQDFLEDEPHEIEPKGPYSRWEEEDWFFSDDGHGMFQADWLEGCLTRGLVTIREMLTADTPKKTKFLESLNFLITPFVMALMRCQHFRLHQHQKGDHLRRNS